MLKIFESDQKRLKGILIAWEEKKQDVNPIEIQQRNEVIEILKESVNLLRVEIEEQNYKVEFGGYSAEDKIDMIKNRFKQDTSDMD